MKKRVVFFVFLILSVVSYSLNFSIYPNTFNLDANKVTTEEITIINNTLEPLRVEVTVEADDKFGKENNLNSNITIFPKSIAVKAGGTQKIRFRVKPSENIKEGINKSLLTFREVPYEIKSTEQEQTESGIGTQIRMITELSVPVYTIGENLVKDVEVKDVKLKVDNSIFKLSCLTISKGNAPVYIEFEIESEDKKFKTTGAIGNTARFGEKFMEISFNGDKSLKGKKVKLILRDTEGKIYCDKIIKI